MPDYFAPGVYIEEFESGSKPIAGASTSIAAFIGSAQKGPCNEAVLVNSFGDFTSVFGGYISKPVQYLAYAVELFFKNGGSNAYIVRAVGSAGKPEKASVTIADAGMKYELEFTALADGLAGNNLKVAVSGSEIATKIIKERNGDLLSTAGSMKFSVQNAEYLCAGMLVQICDKDKNFLEYNKVKQVENKTVYLENALANNYPDDSAIASLRFTVSIKDGVGKTLETFENLSLLRNDLLYFAKVINSAYVAVNWVGDPYAPVSKDELPVFNEYALGGGADDDLTKDRDFGPAFEALKKVDDASIIAVPGEHGAAIYDQLIEHCYSMKYRIALLDPPSGLNVNQIRAIRANEMSSMQGYGAFYYPWLKIVDPVTKETISMPPSGAIAGIYARSDSTRGVHKAPANEGLLGVVGLETQITAQDQNVLNPEGINAIRFFKGRGYLVWGARTISKDLLWNYINVRRLFIYLEQSIYNNTQWVVFEPNNEMLWGRVKMTIEEFLMRVWRDGMLMGISPDQAYYVKCDRTTMTQSDIDNGKLIVEIGVAPTKPAEFVVFRITQWYEGVK